MPIDCSDDRHGVAANRVEDLTDHARTHQRRGGIQRAQLSDVTTGNKGPLTGPSQNDTADILIVFHGAQGGE